ncbi:MAG: TonB-dependent receptor [Verrucomicrobia bacterium]|nr:TonB-dependent receptor [Verrucomicrobiota bacterium]
MRQTATFFPAALLAAIVGLVFSTGIASAGTDLTELSLEELMNIEITLVSKKAKPLSQTAAAVSVLTSDDIRRSGASTIADALRLVPGIHVGQVGSSVWAVAARGFNGVYVNKMLVMVDGRSVYLPLFSGVYWNRQDTALDDIDRIEVVRGPGGTLWGANAVNGVINIITKSAKNTQGGYVQAGTGTEEELFGTVRYGGRLGEHAWYRIYAKTFERDGQVNQAGADIPGDWNMRRTGFRLDWDASDLDTLTMQGDYYEGKSVTVIGLPSYASPLPTIIEDEGRTQGGNVLMRWQRRLDDDADFALQAYYDTTSDEGVWYGDISDTIADVDFQHRFRPSDRHELVWGLGFRHTIDEAPGTEMLTLTVPKRTVNVYSAFLQDAIMLKPDRLSLTVGTKIEHNDYTDFEYQPSARLTYTPTTRRTVWAAVSRAVRTPSRVDHDLRLTGPAIAPGIYPRFVGSDDFESEELMAFELGYRVQPLDNVTLDGAVFYHSYDNLRTGETGMPLLELTPAPPHMVVPTVTANKMRGEAYGFELAANWHPAPWWLMRSGYTFYDLQLRLDDDSLDMIEIGAEDEAPQNLAFVHSTMDLPGQIALDLVVRYVDTVPAFDIDGYIELDARVAWQPTADLELFVAGRNLLDAHHQEYFPKYISSLPADVERSVYAGVTWRF